MSYAGPVRPLVHRWKEHGLRRTAALAAELVVARLEPPAADVVTAVPSDPERQLRRGRHPADRLAGELAVRWDLPAGRLLARTRMSARQTGLPLDERRRNARDAFAARGAVPRTVLLVDDVYTTGATVSAAAAALRAGGARTVHVITFARTVRRPGMGTAP